MTSDSISSLLGWMSIACWVVVYSPQIIENYQLQSGEALSVAFVVIWLIGDICNVVGAVWAKLLPTMIILGVYYAICDVILLFQIYYYRRKNQSALNDSMPASGTATENAPLLPNGPPVAFVPSQPPSAAQQVFRYTGLVTFVLLSGTLAWAANEHLVSHPQIPEPREDIIELKSQVLGWISAFLYLGARIPQIRKNIDTKCEGLSPALFLFAITGNVTYALSILAKSLDWSYLIANASWFVGSAGTLALDLFVLGQFVYYRQQRLATRTLLEV